MLRLAFIVEVATAERRGILSVLAANESAPFTNQIQNAHLEVNYLPEGVSRLTPSG